MRNSSAAAGDQRAFIVVDLGYGDAGKGTIIDYLTRQQDGQIVVRFNGGAQAAHNVMTPDGRHHTFAQFGSGSFVPGVRTLLSRHMLIDPYAMFNEADHLVAVGVPDAFARTLLDRRALVITPYQQAANRLRERARGAKRHGTCGVGIGETVADALQTPDDALYAGDLPDTATTIRKLRLLRAAKRAEIAPILADLRRDPAARADCDVFDDETIIAIAAENYAYLCDNLTLIDAEAARTLLNQPGTILFEGAQGVLLDQDHGFAPHVTWSKTTFDNALSLLADADYAGDIRRLGVLRTYFTRHGAGPFVTEDAALRPFLPEPHNDGGSWQGTFRVGWFDTLSARYALAVCGGVDGLAITHVDRLASLPDGRICTAYRSGATLTGTARFFDSEGELIRGIRVQSAPAWAYQMALAERVAACTPVYTPIRTDPGAYLATLADLLEAPVVLQSHGPTANHKRGTL